MAITPHPEAITLTEEPGQPLRTLPSVTMGQPANREKGKSHETDASVIREMIQQQQSLLASMAVTLQQLANASSTTPSTTTATPPNQSTSLLNNPPNPTNLPSHIPVGLPSQ